MAILWFKFHVNRLDGRPAKGNTMFQLQIAYPAQCALLTLVTRPWYTYSY
jgi:hypothetical protein